MRRVYRFGPFELDIPRRLLAHGGNQVRISASLMKVLIHFVSTAGELVTREQLAVILWEEPQYVDTTTGINTAVNRLRAILADNTAAPRYIATEIGSGYRFIAKVEDLSGQDRLSEEKAPASGFLIPNGNGAPTPQGLSSVGEIDGASRATTLAIDFAKEGMVREEINDASKPTWRKISLVTAIAIALGASFLWFWHIATPKPTDSGAWLEPQMDFYEETFYDAERQITASAISHNGHQLAFSDQSGISVRLLDRNVDRILPSPLNLKVRRIGWLPGDKSLLVSGTSQTGANDQVWLISLGAESPKQVVADGTDGVISPHGDRIAFTRRHGAEIWVADETGAGQRRLSSSVEENVVSSLTWSPDGKRLFYQSRRAPMTNSKTINSREERSYRWAYESVDATSGRNLAIEPNIRFSSACILQDGRMYFPQDQDAVGSPSQVLMVRTDLGDGHFISKPKPIAHLPLGHAFSLSASDNGSSLTVVIDGSFPSVFVADVRRPRSSLLTVKQLVHPAANNYPHAWTPSGDAVLFESDSLGKYSIFIQKTDGSPAQLLVKSVSGAVLPQVSPDGKWVLFSSIVNFKRNAIYRVPLEGGELRQVPHIKENDEFACSISTHGACVVREARGADISFVALDPVVGLGDEVGRVNWTETLLGDWSISPDGGTVAMAIHDPENPGIRLVQLNSGFPSRQTDLPIRGYGSTLEATWSSDSQGFYVEAKADHLYSLLYVNLAGRVSVLLKTDGPTWAVPSRDGKKIAFVDRSPATNVWIANVAKP